jgi:hypothetical protein
VNVSTIVDELIVEGFIDSLNVTVTVVDVLTPDARCAGVTETTFGGVISGAEAVVKTDENCAESGWPAGSRAPVVTMTE